MPPPLNSFETNAIFICGGRKFDLRSVIDSAYFYGEIQPLWHQFLKVVGAEKKAEVEDAEIDDDAVDSAAEQFRYEHDLITAEETERWLTDRGLNLLDFSEYFVRLHWINFIEGEETESTDFAAASGELREAFIKGLILSDESVRMAQKLAERVSAKAALKQSLTLLAPRSEFLKRHDLEESQVPDWLEQFGRTSDWLDEMLEAEAAYQAECAAQISPAARAREIAGLRLPLTNFEVETVEFDSEDAAREGLLCVREDEMSMEEVAEEGRYAYRSQHVLLEDLPELLQAAFLSGAPGELMAPVAQGDGFHLYRIAGKTEPDLSNLVVRERAEKRILERHFAELTARHIRWMHLPSVDLRTS